MYRFYFIFICLFIFSNCSSKKAILTTTQSNVQNSNQMNVVSSLKELRNHAILNGNSYQVVQVLGHTWINDGGAGQFYWDANSEQVDDNGYHIKSNNQLEKGCWIRLTDKDEYIAAHFGVSSKQSPNFNTKALLKIISLTKEGSIKKIILPAGIVSINKTLKITTPIELIGMGRASTWLVYQGVGNAIEVISSKKGLADIKISSFSIQGNNQAQSGLFFDIGEGSVPTRIIVDNIRIQSFKDENNSNQEVAGLLIKNLNEALFLNCQFYANQNGAILHTNRWNITTVSFSRCSFSHNLNKGILIEEQTRGVSFTDQCVFEANGTNGIVVNAVDYPIYNLRFENIWVEGNNKNQSITQNPYEVVFNTKKSGIIRNLYFSGLVGGDGQANGGGIYIGKATGVIETVLDTENSKNRTAIYLDSPNSELKISKSFNVSKAPINPKKIKVE